MRQLSTQVRQLLRGGDAEGALRGCLEQPVYNGTDAAKVNIFFHFILYNATEKLQWLWVKIATNETWKSVGSSAADNHRGLAVNQGERDDAAPKAHLRVRWWQRMPRRPHEIYVCAKIHYHRVSSKEDTGPNIYSSLATRAWALDKMTRAAARQQRSRPNQRAASAR